MRRVEGTNNVKLLECINPVKDRWHVRWDVQQGEDGSATYMEETLSHKPSEDEIKSLITGWDNTETNLQILRGFVWKDIPVWLSTENQNNFKVAHDLALQTDGATLPVKFKLGEDADGQPLYFMFEDLETLTDFYIKSVKHVQDTLSGGWEMKDNFNPAEYRTE